MPIVPTQAGDPPDSPVRIAFSTLAFPDASLASAVSLGRQWGYAGVELRLIDGELIDPRMPAAARATGRSWEAVCDALQRDRARRGGGRCDY